MSVEISCQPYSGRGQLSHYYHFFFACLLPLIDFRCSHLPLPPSLLTPTAPPPCHLSPTAPPHCHLSPNLYTALGPFRTTLTRELNLCSPFPPITSSTPLHQVLLPSYDIYDNLFYSNTSVPRMDPKVTRAHMRLYFNEILSSSAGTKGEVGVKSAKIIILLIERSVEPYHNTSRRTGGSIVNGMKYTSGSARRKIRNHQELVQALREKYGNDDKYIILNESLEGKDIRAQYALFTSARLVVAQHGAALSNMVFMDESDSHVVEISPPFSRRAMYFKNLAHHLGLTYSSVLQVFIDPCM
jgi:hypothetical protein